GCSARGASVRPPVAPAPHAPVPMPPRPPARGRAGPELQAQAPGDCASAVDLVPFIDEIEELGGLADALRGSENQEAPGFQGVVEERYDLPLQDLVEIDQEVSAAHQIEPREGRVAGEV